MVRTSSPISTRFPSGRTRPAAGPPPGPSRTAFVTADANFRLWVASMGYQFSGREFAAFDRFEDAERFLDAPTGERARSAHG